MDLITTAIVSLLTHDPAKLKNENVWAAYESLLIVLRQEFGVESSLLEAINLFEKRPDSSARQEVLQEEVTVVQADQSPEVLAAARALLDSLAQTERGNIQTAILESGLPVIVPHQRPTRLEHFIGGEVELEQLLTNLQPGKVVTLSGPGGVGKSVLAAKAVWTLAPHAAAPENFPDGMIYHNFYTQPQVSLALERIVRAYNEEIQPSPQQAAQRALANRRVLLILDEAEYADDLAALVAVRGQSGVLITTRRSSGASDEVHQLTPLSPETAVKLLELEAWGWIRSNDKMAAQEACDLLGGLPLAVRLAGRYLTNRKQSMSEFLGWLRETGLGRISKEERYEKSVPILLERILAHLGDMAQQTLAVAGLLALAPFNQDVVAEALARRAHGGLFGTFQKIFKQKPDELTPEVSQALDRLVNYGLLQWVGKGYEVTHPLIHAFARQHLTAPEGAAKRLVNYYTTLVGEQILLGFDGYARLDIERPHLIGLITRTIEQEDWESAHNLAAAIEDYLDLQGHWAERVITNEAGLMAAHNLELHNESSWLGSLGLVYNNGGQPERAIEYYQQALTLARQHNDNRSEGNWLGNMGLAYRDMGQFDLARQYLEQAIAIFDDIQSPNADLIRDWLAEFEDE